MTITMRNLMLMVEGRQSPAQKLIDMAGYLDRSPVRLSLDVEDADSINVRRLMVWPPDARGEGHATRAMKDLCKLADRLGVTLQLEALPDDDEDDMNIERLVSFYSRFGFQGGDNPAADRMMWRLPSKAGRAKR